MKRYLKAAGKYDFRSVVFSHGWSDLAPFYVQDTDGTIRVALQKPSGPISVSLSAGENGIFLDSPHEISREDVSALRWMFRLDDDLQPFYRLTNKHGRRWVAKRKMGRLLRSQTVFEDLIKLILTTNCSWSLTRTMTDRLAHELGEITEDGLKTFPTAEALADKPEGYYRMTIRAGYRSPHIPKVAGAVVSGQLDLRRWQDPEFPVDILRKEILKIPGAGPYVADNVLRFLGRFEYMGMDSWGRAKLQKMWNKRTIPTDKVIGQKYRDFGDYRGLAVWCDLTKDWFETGELKAWIRTGERA